MSGTCRVVCSLRAKPDVSHLRAFGAPCAIVEPNEKLRKLDDRASMCFFVGYRVWDPKRRVVVESRDIVARLQQHDADGPAAQPAPDLILEPPTPPNVPPTPQPAATPHTTGTPPDAAPEPTPQQQQQQQGAHLCAVRRFHPPYLFVLRFCQHLAIFHLDPFSISTMPPTPHPFCARDGRLFWHCCSLRAAAARQPSRDQTAGKVGHLRA